MTVPPTLPTISLAPLHQPPFTTDAQASQYHEPDAFDSQSSSSLAISWKASLGDPAFALKKPGSLFFTPTEK